MNYEFIDKSIQKDNTILPNSDKINPFLLRNNYSDILKAVDFIASKEKFLYIHGFMGTGKRQFINYICEFIDQEVIKLEYYCKESTVCDDILLTFTEIIDQLTISKAINYNTKITTLNVKLQQQISSIKKPFLIVLHSFDDIQDTNQDLVKSMLKSLARETNVKLIISTRAMVPSLLDDLEEDQRIFLKAFSKEIFKEFLETNQIKATGQVVEDFYKYTRGYYYYVALTVKIIQAMKIDLNEFLQKFNQSEMSFDSFLGVTYINLIPNTIRNFFWFLRTIRHGLTLNALAELELYDDLSIEYLKTNLMIFQANETIYVQDYFLQKIDISIPEKTEIKLHKYIIGIYESQLKAQIKDRVILISRQALRAEIEYHNNCISKIENKDDTKETPNNIEINSEEQKNEETKTIPVSIASQLENARALLNDKKYTDAIELFLKILTIDNLDSQTQIDLKLNLARAYKTIGENTMATHYYELVESYYEQNKEYINLNYLYYEMTDLYFKMYKNNRAIDTIKKVIYSVDTPQSLMVGACLMLGNIYSEMNNSNEAFSYYKKALESLDENVDKSVLAELYFKFALSNDDREMLDDAFEYYNKCISIPESNPYKALAYSNLGSCYLDNENYTDAKACFKEAYKIEKTNNNYDGIFYTASKLAKIFNLENSSKALNYLLEAKKCAEFINEDFYILESTVALGDYYYNDSKKIEDALKEYLKAQNIASNLNEEIDISKIESRIEDMKHRLAPDIFKDIVSKYAK